MSSVQGVTQPTTEAGEWRERWSKMAGKVERVTTSAEEQALLARLSQPQQPCVLAFANAHAMNLQAASPAFFQALDGADMVLRDGAGMAMLLALLGMRPGRNLNGTDLIPRLLAQFDGRAIALFGTQNPSLDVALDLVKRQIAPRSPCVSAHGFLQAADYTALAAAHRPALIVLGMGMPRQEEVAIALRAALAYPCLIVCGGAILDFLGGKTPRAPLWMRRVGLEWLFRLGCEPRRLFRRYVVGNPLFMARALRLAVMKYF
jgi:exopolysaccharide biosynthesis WecB/TagA/CpsF family protein